MRARNLKPSFFKNELLGSADPLYGIIFQGLWCLADRAGRLEDRALRIHVEVNPYRDSASTVLALDWLVLHQFLIRYEVGGVRYLQVVNFAQHQQPHIKEAPSKIPPYENQGVVQAPDEHRASTGLARLIPSSLTPDSGLLTPDSPFPPSRAVEPLSLTAPPAGAPKKVAREKPASRETTIPPDLDLSGPRAASATKHLPADCDAAAEFEKFKSFFGANGRKYVNWDLAWNGWALRAKDRTDYARKPAQPETTPDGRRKAGPGWWEPGKPTGREDLA